MIFPQEVGIAIELGISIQSVETLHTEKEKDSNSKNGIPCFKRQWFRQLTRLK